MKPSSIWVLLTTAALAVTAPTASDAKPQATCKAMCQRLTDCKMASYTKMCLDSCKQYGYEASEEGRAQLLVLTRYTCKQIQSAVGAMDTRQPQQASKPSSSPQGASPQGAPPPGASSRSASPRAPSPRAPSPRAPAPASPYDDDDDDPGPPAAGPDRGQRSSRAAGGDDPGDTSCSWVCRRMSECNLMAYQRCGEICSMAASSDHPLRIGRESCAEIKKAFVTSKWTCWADGSTGASYDNGPYTYRNKSTPADGRTRDEAALQALRDCNALLSADANLKDLSGAETETAGCHVTRCIPPGTPMR